MTSKKPTITYHTTGPVDVKFMAIARPLTNKKSGKEEYSLKSVMDRTDPALSHLKEIAEYKVDTKTNRNLEDKSKVVINFSSTFAPKVKDVDGNELLGKDIPFFDGRTDTGTAIVTYSVIDYGDNKIVRLAGVQLLSLNLAPREEKGGTVDQIKAKLRN